MNLEDIKKRICSDYYRTITEAEADVVWLVAEVEQLRAEYDAYRETAAVEADVLRKDVATRCIELIQNAQMTRSAVGMKIKKEYGL